MFEKEAEEYADREFGTIQNDEWENCVLDWRDGAEYGYNKKCEETFEMALSQIKHDRAVVIEENERLHAKNACLEECAKELTEAKELLKRWVDDKVTVSEQKDLIADTEQFLNGEVEK